MADDPKEPTTVELAKAVDDAKDERDKAKAKRDEAQAALDTADQKVRDASEALASALGFTTEAPQQTRRGRPASPVSFTREDVLNVLENASGWMARADIADALGIPNDDDGRKQRDRLGAKLRAMLHDGDIATNGKEKVLARWATNEAAEQWTATEED